MSEDEILKRYLDDNERYADLINGFTFGGEQIVKAEDLAELDTQAGYHKKTTKVKGKKNTRYRDLFRRASFGTNFAVIGVENQKQTHYLMPLRCMEYDLKEYQRQEVAVRKYVEKKTASGDMISSEEFLSRFPEWGKLHPCITIVLYYGEGWKGSTDLHGLMDFKNIPEELQGMVNNYKLNLLNIKELESTEMYHSDLRQVFDFIRYSKDKEKLKELLETDENYANLDEDAYDVIAAFTKSEELMRLKEKNREGEKQDMCQALKEWAAEERREGKLESLRAIMENLGFSLERAMDVLNIPMEDRAQYIANI